MKLKIVFMALFSLFVLSCATQKRCGLKYPVQASKDSIYIERVKEVPILIPGDTIKVNVPVNCPDQDVFKIENSKLKQEVSILNGRLTSKTEIKPDTVFIPVVEKQTIINEVKVPEPVKFIPKFYKYCAFILISLVVIAIIYFAIKYKLKILTLFKK